MPSAERRGKLCLDADQGSIVHTDRWGKGHFHDVKSSHPVLELLHAHSGKVCRFACVGIMCSSQRIPTYLTFSEVTVYTISLITFSRAVVVFAADT